MQATTDAPSSPEATGLTAYELARLELIARNRARLIALGIPEAVEGLQRLAPHKAKRAPAPRAKQPPQEPSRKSARLEGIEAVAQGGLPPGIEAGSELAEFYETGECPRCGRQQLVLERQQGHLARCQGPPEPPTEEEIARRAESMRDVEAARLRDLEMGGLVEWSAEPSNGEVRVVFIVIGSRGDHYSVRLTTHPEAGKRPRVCECMDCRVRKRDCKHIRLIMEQLGVGDAYDTWPQALERRVAELQAADDSDVERVKGQEEHARKRKEKAAPAVAERAAAAAASAGPAEGGGEAEEGGGGDRDEDDEQEAQPAGKRKARGRAAAAGKSRGGAKKRSRR